MAPLEARSRLDLELGGEVPLAPAEHEEARSLLAFLRRFKPALRLSLNATEDLLVNGARDPEDRGVLKHLFAKVDRAEVEAALTREPLKSQTAARSAFLAGVVRLHPEPSTLLSYLETLVELHERRDAASALELTVARIDFEQLSSAQLARLLELIPRIFAGPERVQAAVGLLASASFSRALGRGRDKLPAEVQRLFDALNLAHGAVMRGAPIPDDDGGRALLKEGLELWLSVPDSALRGYSLATRARLAGFCARASDILVPKKVPRALFDSLPHKDPLFAELALPWAERLLRHGEDEAARGLVARLVDTHPKVTQARRYKEALAWPQLGRVTIDPTHDAASPPRLRRAFLLDTATFGWVRTATPESAGALFAESKLQTELLVPGVLPGLAHGLGRDGTAYAFQTAEGRPLAERPSLEDALRLALDGVRILRTLAVEAITLPDADLARFVVRGRPVALLLADLTGAIARDPAHAALVHGPMAQALSVRLLSSQPCATGTATPRDDLPPSLADRLRSRLPLVLLGRALSEALAKHLSARA